MVKIGGFMILIELIKINILIIHLFMEVEISFGLGGLCRWLADLAVDVLEEAVWVVDYSPLI